MEFVEHREISDSDITLELRRERLLVELALSEDDLNAMAPDQRILVEDIISKVIEVRAAA